jgi:Flp pilus assembly protein CpaB
VLLVFMSKYKDSVGGGAADVEVLVADENIDVGTSGDVIAEFQLFRAETVTDDEALEGAITDPSALAGHVVTEPISEGQQFTEASLSGTSDPVVGKLEGAQRAISVPVSNAPGNIGTIKSGSQVDVFAVPEDNNFDDAGTLKVLARDLMVLRVPDAQEEGGGAGISNQEDSTVVLRATDVEAGRIALATSSNKIWLIVRPPTRAKDSQIDAEALESLGTANSVGG